jgi:hypothetical protein
MGLWESLSWGPELTKPPLYQFSLRLLTQDPRPSEAQLRFPAALCGLLTILAGWWVGKLAGGWSVGLAVAGLLAFNGLQIEYSQEARPYSMLVVACTLSSVLWYRLVVDVRRVFLYGYIITATLALYAHYLAALTILAHALWWVVVLSGRPQGQRPLRPLAGLLVTGLLCVPLAVRYLYYKSSLFQGLDWIDPPTWQRSQDVLEELTFGWHWVYLVFATLVALWIAGAFGLKLRRLRRPGGSLFAGREDICGLLLVWWLCAWFGLLVISWLTHPAMVARYALPGAVPMLLLPLVVAHRLDRRVPLVVMAVFIASAAPVWMGRTFEPGCREMVAYLNTHVDPEGGAVVLAIDSGRLGWEEMERMPFRYYPLDDLSLLELPLRPNGRPVDDRVLTDPRTLYLVVFRSEPSEILAGTGRRIVPIVEKGLSYSQLLFAPYRLVVVAPLAGG